MRLPNLIGIAGPAGSGKTHLAGLMSQSFGYRVAHYADPVREMCRRLNPIIGESERSVGQFIRWGDLELLCGYAGAKAHPFHGPEFRAVMQRLATEGGRGVLGEDVWVDALFRGIAPARKTVIGDVRFPNEADAVVARGGLIVRVSRPGVTPAPGAHVSETALDDWGGPCVRVVNDGIPEGMLGQLLVAAPEVTS